MKTIDLVKELKPLYTAKRKPEEVTAGAGVFLSVAGQGKPGGTAFIEAIGMLYATAYTLKFALKAQGALDFKVTPLECLYFSDPRKTRKSEWQWELLLRIPDAVKAADLSAVKKALREKKGFDATAVKRKRWKEGRAVQVLHVGPYEGFDATYRAMTDYAAAEGLTPAGPAHEIYLNNPQRTAPNQLKTLCRMPVAKKKGTSRTRRAK